MYKKSKFDPTNNYIERHTGDEDETRTHARVSNLSLHSLLVLGLCTPSTLLEHMKAFNLFGGSSERISQQ